MRVVFEPKADEFLRGMDTGRALSIINNIQDAVNMLSTNGSTDKIKRMRCPNDGVLRVTCGRYRAFCVLNDGQLVVQEIAKRDEKTYKDRV